MAFNQAGSSSKSFPPTPFGGQYGGSPSRPESQPPQPNNPPFDILEWYPQYQSCHRYFLDHAQHSMPVQAIAAFINIQLPCQKQPVPVMSSNVSSPRSAGPDIPHLRQPNPFGQNQPHTPVTVSLLPYLRRLIVTGHDNPGILHGFFGDDWVVGVGSLHEVERRNYMFASKSASWLKVKQAYDMSPEETVPFLSALKDTTEREIEAAESKWSEWLAMQDWMLGPRSPDVRPNDGRSPRIKREREAGD